MAKKSGMGDNLFFAGYDLSNDIRSLDIGMPSEYLDVTGIDKSAHERVYGKRDGSINLAAYFNDAAGRAHPVFKTRPTTDIQVLYCRGTALGDPACGQVAKQIGYNPTRDADGSLIMAVQTLANLYPTEWGKQLTAGPDNITGAGNGTGVDYGVSGAAVTITSSSVANPTNILCAAAHGLTTGDRVVIAGHTGSTPSINSVYTATVVDTTNFTIPVNVTVGGTGGTVTKTSRRFGLAAYLQVMGITGTSVTFTVQESNDDGVSDAYANVTGGAFAAVSGANVVERIETSLTQVVERWLRWNAAGTFTSCDFVLMVIRYTGANRET